nr:reverse transcriptase domain-containing protein [Tanacetum cinerariifolium]
MRTRSQSRENLHQQEASPAIIEHLRIENPFLEDQFQEDPPKDPPEVPMADDRTMAELLRAPTEGYEEAIVIPEITTNNFKLKHVFPFFENDESSACPHHGFSELHQLDTFYNALNVNDQDSLNSAAGGNFLDKMPRECLKIIESKSKVRQSRAKAVVAKVSMSSSTPAISSDVAELKDMVKALLLDKKKQSLAPTSSSTCGGTHSYQNCPATSRNAYRDNIQEYVSQAAAANYNQGNTGFRPQMVANQIRPPGFPPHQNHQNNFNRGNNFSQNRGVMRNMQNQGQNVQNQLANLTDMLSKFMSSNTASSSGSGGLPGNTVTNPKEYLKGITTRSGVAYQGPTITPSKQGTEVTKDQVQNLSSQSTTPVQPSVSESEVSVLTSEPANTPVIASKPNPQASIPYPSRRNDERNREKSKDQIEKFYQIFKDMSFEISFSDALILMPKFASTLKALIGNKEKLGEMARTSPNEHCTAVLLKKLPEKLGDPGKFLIPCDFSGMAECLALADLSASINLMPYFVWKKLSLPDLTPTCMTLELADRSISRPVGVAEDVCVKVGLFHFLVDFVVVDFDADPRVPLILGRSFLKTEKALIDVFEGELPLRVNKEAITFNLDQTSRYSANYNNVTAKRIDVIDMACEEYAQEVLGFSDTAQSGNPTPLSDPIVSATSPTLTPFGESDFLLEEVDAFLAVEDESISSLNQSYLDPEGDILILESFLNDDPSLPPPNQRNSLPEVSKELKICEAKTEKSSVDEPPVIELKALPSHLEYAFLEGDNKLPVIIAKDLSVEEKADLITILKSHKRAIAWKLSDIKGINPEFCSHKILLEEDFTPAVQHQRRVNPKIHDVIKQEEKSHFMVKEGIVLGHKISKKGIEVDKAKIDVISKLPHLTTVKAPDWDMPFELMCDASDYAIGVVLGHRRDKLFWPIHYASKTMTEAESKYTTTEKEMLAVEFTFKVVDTKGAENLAADHLSRLENPHQNVLDPKEINESFPLETLNLISSRGSQSTPCIQNTHRVYSLQGCVWKSLPSSDRTRAQSLWTLKYANFDLSVAGDHRKVQLNELNELHDHAYENSLIYKEKTKRIHDSKIKNRVFNVGDRVLLFNSRLKIFSGKLKTRWSRPFTITKVFPYGTVELSQANGPNFKVNGHRVKHYSEGTYHNWIARIVKTFILSVLSFIHKSFTSSASFWESNIQILSSNVLSFGIPNKWP